MDRLSHASGDTKIAPFQRRRRGAVEPGTVRMRRMSSGDFTWRRDGLAYVLPKMIWSAECAAIVPCLNEAGTIGALVREIRRQINRVYVIDDGSTDDTGQVAEAVGAVLLRNSSSQGKGAALQRGFARAIEDGFSWAMTLDGDGQHAPSEINRFFAVAEETPRASIVVGNRMDSPNGMPPLRRAVNRWMSARLSRLAGISLPDTQCGFRLVRLADLGAFRFACSHFDFESELLIRLVRAGKIVEFAPVSTIYGNERSKIHPLRDTVRWFQWYRRAAGTDGPARIESGTSSPALEKGFVS